MRYYSFITFLSCIAATSNALDQASCSLECTPRFYSQQGIPSLNEFFETHVVVTPEDINKATQSPNKNTQLAVGCLATCPLKDMRHVICQVLGQPHSPQNIDKLGSLLRQNPDEAVLAKPQQEACLKRLKPTEKEIFQANYLALKKAKKDPDRK